jgi:hypothetical protein
MGLVLVKDGSRNLSLDINIYSIMQKSLKNQKKNQFIRCRVK